MRLVALLLGWLTYAVPVSSEEVLHLYNWSDYLPTEVLERFQAESGITVRYSTYDSNEALYAKLKLLGGQGYDVVVPSTYFVDRMRREGLLQKLDRSRLPHFGHLASRHLNQPFDPGNLYSVPYLWGSTGIGVDSRRFDPALVRGWSDLWHPQFRGSLLLSNDVREVFFIGLRSLGYSGNSRVPEEVRQAYEKLRTLMPNVRLFNSDAPQVLFITGEVDAGMLWSGNAVRVRRENPALHYIYPEEGCSLWMDNLVIPVGARQVDAAHRLIDFLLRPDIAARVAEKLLYASPNAGAIAQLPATLRDDPVIYPSEEIIDSCEYSTDIGEAATLYTRYWERLKVGE